MIDRARALIAPHRGLLLMVAAGLLILWIGFFDSHSLYKRAAWHNEAVSLRQQNAELEAEIARLKTELARDLTDEQVEKIAREQYGMQREGETVHPIREGE